MAPRISDKAIDTKYEGEVPIIIRPFSSIFKNVLRFN